MSERTTKVIINCSRKDCDGEMEVELSWEDPDPSFGQDADGNRGVYVPGYWYGPAAGDKDFPEVCSTGHVFSVYEKIEIEVSIIESAETESGDDPDDDYYPDNED